MTIYDVTFLALFFGVLLMLAIGGIGALLRLTRVRRTIFRLLTIFAIAYVGAWIGVTAWSKQPPLRVGDPQCVDIGVSRWKT